MKTMDDYLKKARTMLEDQFGHHDIEQHLLSEGADESTIQVVMQEVKRLRVNKRVNRGLSLITVGVLFLGAGCLCTLCFSNENFNYHISLYGFTTLGILLVFAGMIDIFG